MDAAVKRDHQAGKLALLGLSLLPSRAHIAVYHDRKDDIVIPVRVACLRKRPLSGTMRRAQFSSFVHFAARLLGACPTRFRLRFNLAVQGEHDGCGIINGVAVLSLSSSLCLVET